MLMTEVAGLMEAYFDWLRDRTVLRQVSQGWVEITTPHLDRHNDYLQLYVREGEAGYALTDGGYVLRDLELSGCPLDTPKRRDLLQATLNGFGVEQRDGMLTVVATRDNFALRKHSLIQAMLAVDDLFYLAQPTVQSLFYEDVVAWLDESGIRYVPDARFTGKSGYDHRFEFVIPKSRLRPERLVSTMNRPDKDAAQSIVFKWFDTRETRSSGSAAYAVLNDRDQTVPQPVVEALRNYEVRPVLWSQREEHVDELAA